MHLALARNHSTTTPHFGESRSMVFATGRLSFGETGALAGLTTVQGLPSNSLYAVHARGKTVYVGTLGGLAMVEAGKSCAL